MSSATTTQRKQIIKQALTKYGLIKNSAAPEAQRYGRMDHLGRVIGGSIGESSGMRVGGLVHPALAPVGGLAGGYAGHSIATPKPFVHRNLPEYAGDLIYGGLGTVLGGTGGVLAGGGTGAALGALTAKILGHPVEAGASIGGLMGIPGAMAGGLEGGYRALRGRFDQRAEENLRKASHVKQAKKAENKNEEKTNEPAAEDTDYTRMDHLMRTVGGTAGGMVAGTVLPVVGGPIGGYYGSKVALKPQHRHEGVVDYAGDVMRDYAGGALGALGGLTVGGGIGAILGAVAGKVLAGDAGAGAAIGGGILGAPAAIAGGFEGGYRMLRPSMQERATERLAKKSNMKRANLAEWARPGTDFADPVTRLRNTTPEQVLGLLQRAMQFISANPGKAALGAGLAAGAGAGAYALTRGGEKAANVKRANLAEWARPGTDFADPVTRLRNTTPEQVMGLLQRAMQFIRANPGKAALGAGLAAGAGAGAYALSRDGEKAAAVPLAALGAPAAYGAAAGLAAKAAPAVTGMASKALPAVGGAAGMAARHAGLGHPQPSERVLNAGRAMTRYTPGGAMTGAAFRRLGDWYYGNQTPTPAPQIRR